MRGVEWRAKYKCPIIRFITKSNKSVQHQFTTITSKEVVPGIKFHGLILMSSRLINFTSDLHGSLKNILRADDIHDNTINRVICYKWNRSISIRLHMQDHNIPLSLFIISVYILTVLVLWNIFSNGHVTVTSCLFLWYDPSTPKKSLKHGKSTNASSQIRDFLPFSKFKMSTFNDSYHPDSERSDS